MASASAERLPVIRVYVKLLSQRVRSRVWVRLHARTGTHKYSEERVVVDGNIVTSRAPGTAIEWALEIVEQLCGREVRDKVLLPMFVNMSN
jgi:protein DJ-1